MKNKFWRFLSASLALTIVASSTVRADKDDDNKPDQRTELSGMIGCKAPPLEIEHWVENKDGKFPPITQFENGKVYVIEFWATWCHGCVLAMPHLAELQQEYGEKVRIVNVSNESIDKVTNFLQRNFEDGMTYGELTANFSLTTDPDGGTWKDYLSDAGINILPMTFIVGQTGLVEWIGSPTEMDLPLKDVVDGTWDRTSFADLIEKGQLFRQVWMDLMKGIPVSEEKKIETLSKMDAVGYAPGNVIQRRDQDSLRLMLLSSLGKKEELNKVCVDAIEAAGDSTEKLLAAIGPMASPRIKLDPELIKPATKLAIKRLEPLLEREASEMDDRTAMNAFGMLGFCYIRVGRKSEAVAQFDRVLALVDDENQKKQMSMQINWMLGDQRPAGSAPSAPHDKSAKEPTETTNTPKPSK